MITQPLQNFKRVLVHGNKLLEFRDNNRRRSGDGGGGGGRRSSSM